MNPNKPSKHDEDEEQQQQQQQSIQGEVDQLRYLLELREKELQVLKYELEKYKLALHQSQSQSSLLDHHHHQQQQQQQIQQRQLQHQFRDKQTAHDNQYASEALGQTRQKQSEQVIEPSLLISEIGTLINDDDDDVQDDHISEHEKLLQNINDTGGVTITDISETPDQVQLPIRKRCQQQSQRISAANSPSAASPSPRIIFKTGCEDEDEEELEVNRDGRKDTEHESSSDQRIINQMVANQKEQQYIEAGTVSCAENLDDIIQDVSEIDLNLDIQVVDSKKEKNKKRKQLLSSSLLNEREEEGEEEKDAEIDAVDDDDQEEESGELELEQDITLDEVHICGDDDDDDDDEDKDVDDGDGDIMSDGLLTSLTDAAICNLSQLAALQERCESQQHSHHPYQSCSLNQETILPTSTTTSSSTLASKSLQQLPDQSAVTAQLPTPISSTSPLADLSQQLSQQHQLHQNANVLTRADQNHHPFIHHPFSTSAIANQAAIAINAAAAVANSMQPVSVASNSISPPSAQNVDSSSIIQPTELTSSHSLASVVAAAALAAAAANDQQQHHSTSHHHLNSQVRLISSAIPSSDYYHHTLNHHHHHQQHPHQHPQQHPSQDGAHQLHSSVSSLHFSPSTSVTPSSSSLIAQTRRSASNASSSLMSPIASPNYLRRQFMPDRLPLLSPSPTSGLGTGSSSGASSSLAHILHQRSASALAGAASSSLTTPSTAASTPLSSAGSTAVSPLMSNKNSQIRLNNMQIRHKFGYLGSGRAQFNSPHGFCLGLSQEIVVADTNNHRICIFDKSGTYITQFGSPGKEEGQLWNPRKVAILNRPINTNVSSSINKSFQNKLISHHSNNLSYHFYPHSKQQQQQVSHLPYSNHIGSSNHSNALHSYTNTGSHIIGATEPLYVVCDRGAERSRMQLFTKDGNFIKKIGIHYIDIVAGLAITQNGLIIVVDSVSPTVYIINGETGILNGWFDCSGHMKEPSDIAVKSDVPGNEYFICDFKGHCVVVFSEQGEYLRKIGHDGLTSYPNGIDISDDGDILVGDSHGNRFHVVVFDRNGNFVSQFECPHVKVSRCCGLKITREGYIVTLAKNNHHVLVLDTIHI